MTRAMWDRVTVVGCGLIGASFALALRRAGACRRLAGWDSSPRVLDEALGRGVIDEVDTSFAEGGVSPSDLIYLATPVCEIVSFLRERGRQVKPGAVVTDAGSTKQEVCRAVNQPGAARSQHQATPAHKARRHLPARAVSYCDECRSGRPRVPGLQPGHDRCRARSPGPRGRVR